MREASGCAGLLGPGLKLIDIDTLDPTFPSDDLRLSIGGEASACLIYTSGSTGSPKGVVQTHRSLLNRTQAFADVLRVSPQDRLSLLASCSVAQGVSGTLQALINGASIHPFDLRGLGVGELAPWLVAHAITVLTCAPSAFRHFAKTITADDTFPTLRVIRLGSEQVLPHDFELYRQHFHRGCTFVGTLGSTEAGPVSTYAMHHDSAITDVVPAGYPLDGTTVKILDDDGRVCPAGEPGEIVVQNSFLCLGYWRDPDRTNALFADVPDAGRFCRTGDIGRIRPDGCIEYLGRKNLRVKIRGFRVELEEIERSLCTHPSVLEAAVIARPDDRGENRLAAYVVARTKQPPSPGQLRVHLQISLPPQMVPASFEFLPSLPRTAVGKIHRTALAESCPTPATATVNQPPRDAVEMCLTHLWEELLGQQQPINVTDDFFALGGHSLLAARLSAAIERAFGVKLPLATFLTAATVEQQARLLRDRRSTIAWPLLVPINTRGSKPPLFCVHLADGNVLVYRDLARHLPSDQPFYGLQASGLDGKSRIHTRIQDMARDYVAEIRRFYPSGPYAICGWSYGGFIAYEMARQLEQQQQSVALVALFDTHAPWHVRRGRPVSKRAGVRRQFLRAPNHLRELLFGPNRFGYLRRKIQTARELIEIPLWRMFFGWERCGGWFPKRLRSVTRANSIARRNHVPSKYGGHVTLFRATPPPGDRVHDPFMGWGNYVTGTLETHLVPGNHDTMVFDPNAQSLAHGLTRCLDKAGIREAGDGNQAA